MSLSSYIRTLKQDYVDRRTRLKNIRLGRETVKRDEKVLRKYERIRKILKKYDSTKPINTLEKIVAVVDLV